MDKACQECWENHAERQAILKEREEQVKLLLDQYHLIALDLQKAEERVVTLETKVKRSRRLAIGFGSSLGAVLFGMIFAIVK